MRKNQNIKMLVGIEDALTSATSKTISGKTKTNSTTLLHLPTLLNTMMTRSFLVTVTHILTQI